MTTPISLKEDNALSFPIPKDAIALCDKCGLPILKDEYWESLTDDKDLCRNCILDILEEVNSLGLIDWKEFKISIQEKEDSE